MDELELTRAEQINAEHHACEAATRVAIKHALRCGAMLDAQKAELPHGEWLPWLAEHFDGSDRTAQVYMRLHHHRAELPEIVDAQTSTHLSIDGALKALASGAAREPGGADEDGFDLDEARRQFRHHARLHRESYADMERECVQALIQVDASMEIYEGERDEYGPEKRARAEEERAEMEELERYVRAEMDAARHLFGPSPLT
jgi:hypothetical protein